MFIIAGRYSNPLTGYSCLDVRCWRESPRVLLAKSRTVLRARPPMWSIRFSQGACIMTPHEYCQQKAAQSGSSFYYSFLFLPPERRRAITALYAYCREVDDVVDECTDTGVARTKLAWWRNEVAALFAGTPQHPVTKALAPAVERFGVTEARLNEILDGMAMDLHHARYPDFAGLERYCYHVAGVVGLLAAGIF